MCEFYPENAKTKFEYDSKVAMAIYWYFIGFGWVEILANRIKKGKLEFTD